jgi:hypothetical protein
MLADLAMDCADKVERIERPERDRRHAKEWRAELARARSKGRAS